METIKEITELPENVALLKPEIIQIKLLEIEAAIKAIRKDLDMEEMTTLTLVTESCRTWKARWSPYIEGAMSVSFYLDDPSQQEFTYNRVTYNVSHFTVKKNWEGKLYLEMGYMRRDFTPKAANEFREEVIPMIQRIWGIFKDAHTNEAVMDTLHLGPYMARVEEIRAGLSTAERSLYLTNRKASDLSKPTNLDSRRL